MTIETKKMDSLSVSVTKQKNLSPELVITPSMVEEKTVAFLNRSDMSLVKEISSQDLEFTENGHLRVAGKEMYFTNQALRKFLTKLDWYYETVESLDSKGLQGDYIPLLNKTIKKTTDLWNIVVSTNGEQIITGFVGPRYELVTNRDFFNDAKGMVQHMSPDFQLASVHINNGIIRTQFEYRNSFKIPVVGDECGHVINLHNGDFTAGVSLGFALGTLVYKCTNGMVYRDEKGERRYRHYNDAFQSFGAEFPRIRESMNTIENRFASPELAQPMPSKMLTNTAMRLQAIVGKKKTENIIEAVQIAPNKWDAINVITDRAKSFDDIEDRMAIETLAGGLL